MKTKAPTRRVSARPGWLPAHSATGTLHLEKNLVDDAPFGPEKMKRMAAASMIGWHSFDHYGQMVVYARMNGVIPPSSLLASATGFREEVNAREKSQGGSRTPLSHGEKGRSRSRFVAS